MPRPRDILILLALAAILALAAWLFWRWQGYRGPDMADEVAVVMDGEVGRVR